MSLKLAFVIAAIALRLHLCTGESQNLTFYSTTTCSGPLTTFYNTGTYTIPSNTDVKSFRSIGLWQFIRPGYWSQVLYGAGGCSAYAIDKGTNLDITRFGDEFMVGTINGEITFYSEANFLGKEFAVTASQNININMNSFWFTGPNYSWLCYPLPDYMGTPTCLEPTETVVRRGWGHTYAFNRSLSIQSIRKVSSASCSGEVTTSSTTIQPTTTWPTTYQTMTTRPTTTTLPPAKPQFIALYNDSLCDESPELVIFRYDGSYTIPNNFTSVKAIMYLGMWELRVDSIIRGIFQYLSNTSTRCLPVFPYISSGTIQLKRYGDTTMTDTSSISLYTGEKFSGTEYNSFPTSNLNINSSSYWFTGSGYVWLLYPSNNYRGSPTCLEPDYVVKQLGWGHSYSFTQELTVGSIRRSETCFYSGTGNLVPWALSLILISSFTNLLLSN